MKNRLTLVSFTLLLACIFTAGQHSVQAQHNSGERTATQKIVPRKQTQLDVRIYFGQQMGGQLSGPCSDIIIRLTGPDNKVFQTQAEGPTSGATSGQCTGSLKKLPHDVPLTLSAVYSDLPSKPEGNWTNPITLKNGQVLVRHIKIDGKP